MHTYFQSYFSDTPAAISARSRLFSPQPQWAERLAHYGVGRRLRNLGEISAALRDLEKGGVHDRCEQLSRELRLERGVEVAVTALGEFGLLGPRNSPRDGDARKRVAGGAALMEAALAWWRRR